MEFNQYKMYSYNADSAKTQVLDEVDSCRQELMRMTEYDDVKNYLLNKFGEFEGKKWVKSSDNNKSIYMYIDNVQINFAALKDKQQYWGRSWILQQPDDVNEAKEF